MSLLSAVILPLLEKQLAEAAPTVAQFAINQLGTIAGEVLQWIAQKTIQVPAVPSPNEPNQQGQ